MVTEFENKIAAFFGSPRAVAVDSCTHGVELCLRHRGANFIVSPTRTYLSIPMLAKKLNIPLTWSSAEWNEYYPVFGDVFDAAVLWRENSYTKGLMCVSFQYQKHLSLGRGGVILCSEADYLPLKKMSYDGRLPGIPWREQDISTMGYHYYMTPETAELGLQKLPEAISKEPRKWVCTDWPDLSKMEVFK